MECLTEPRLAAHLARALSDSDADAVEAHLDTCDACRQLVARAVRAGAAEGTAVGVEPGGPLPVRFLPQGTTIGRFVVLERLGAGAMGVVYAAYDPQLDRRVALKFLFEQSAGQPPTEARALARLSHPNVTTVHDVGVYGGHPYLAMEFVPGVTLAVWRRTHAPSLAEKLDLLRQAARGLEAAHRAGLAHRDFKPANILVSDGRAWVTDFGLGGPPQGGGALAGTPAYMGPEQLAGRWGDAKSDQYSFAVTAWEVLFDQRPFEAESLTALLAKQRAGLAPRPRSGVPVRLVEALSRALSFEPAQRFESMTALLTVLEQRERRRGRAVGLGLAAATLVAGLVFVTRPADPCRAADAGLAEVWSSAVAQRAHAAFLAAPRAPAPEDEAQLTRDLDTYRQRLSLGYRDACERFSGHHEDEPLYTRRRVCLRQRTVALETVAASLARPEGWSSETRSQVAGALPSVQDCLGAAELQLPALPDDLARRDEVLRLREAVGRFEARWALQDYDALDELSALVLDVRRAQFPPLLAEVLRMQGRWQFVRARYPEARLTLLEAAATALGSGRDVHAINAWNTLASLDATRLERLDEAELVQSLALALSQRAGIDDGLRAQTLFRQGVVRRAQHRLPEAAAVLEEALRLGDAAHRPGYMAGAVTTLATVEREQGFVERSAARLFAQLDQLSRLPEYGPARGSDTWFELGRSLTLLGRSDEAREALRHAQAGYLAIYGPEHPVTKECEAALKLLGD